MKKSLLSLIIVMCFFCISIAGCAKKAEVSETLDSNEKKEVKKENDSSTPKEEQIKVPKEINLYTYYADSSIAIIDSTLEKLKVKYPDLTINIEHRTDSDGTVLKTRAAVGELPDIFECTGELTDILRESKHLPVLDKTIEDYKLASYYLEGNFECKKSSDGHYYAINENGPNACLFYYNTDVFKRLGLEAPKNFEEFKNVVKTLKENNVIPLALFAQQKWPGLQMYDMAVIGQGQTLGISGIETGKTKITDPEYLEAAKKVQELVSLGLLGKGAMNTNASQAFELVGTGQAGMLINGSWFFNDAIAGGWADHIDYFKYNPFTDQGKEDQTQWHMSGGTGTVEGYTVNANGKYVDFCKNLLMDFVVAKSQSSAEQGAISALVNPPAPLNPRPASFQDFADHVANFRSTTKFEWALSDPELIVAFEDTSELLNMGNYNAEQFIDDLKDQISQIDSVPK